MTVASRGAAGRAVLMALAAALALAAAAAAQTVITAAPEPERTLSFHSTHNGERLRVVYRRGENYLRPALDDIKHVLRDPFTNEEVAIDPALLDFLYDLLQKVGFRGEVEVVCGYRCVETNTRLHNQSGGVVLGSQHIKGRALDFRLPGIDTKKAYETARAMKRGGTGYYKASDFIHIDTGPVRSW